MAGRVPALGFDLGTVLDKLKGKTARKYRNQQSVYAQGDAADAVFFIRSGKVKLTVASPRGRKAMIGLLEQGSFFGEGCLAGQALRVSSATAIQPSRIIRVSKSAMARLLHRESAFANAFIAHLLTRTVRLKQDLVSHLFNSDERRLARALLLLAQFGQGVAAEPVMPGVTQEMLATIVGTTRSKVSYFMNRFKKRGFVKYDGGLYVQSGLLSVVLGD